MKHANVDAVFTHPVEALAKPSPPANRKCLIGVEFPPAMGC
ncbi:hypothetical protein [Lysobacter sp. F60174L2]